jgi:hypothetical protein
VLYAERSIDIYRHVNLVDPLSEKLEESAYSDFLQQRCVGCHASPSLTPAFRPAIEFGVACQSCHGSAGGWIDRHYLASWKGGDGFRDLKDLPTRAEVCTSCHVGPVVSEEGTSYHVDHELIAAGHPRLAFELDAYLTNYPKHWDADQDADRYPGSFHVSAWLCGQDAAARKLVEALAIGSPTQPEFSHYDCFDCHHAIQPPAAARPLLAQGEGRSGLPRPALLPLEQLAAATTGDARPPLEVLVQESRLRLENSWMMAGQANPPALEWAAPRLQLLRADDLPDHAAALRQIPAAWRHADWPSPTWDEAAQYYLAVQALGRDLPAQDRQSLAAAADRLAAALGPHNFANQLPTQYDSPANYDARKLASPLEQLDTVLGNLANRPALNP